MYCRGRRVGVGRGRSDANREWGDCWGWGSRRSGGRSWGMRWEWGEEWVWRLG